MTSSNISHVALATASTHSKFMFLVAVVAAAGAVTIHMLTETQQTSHFAARGN